MEYGCEAQSQIGSDLGGDAINLSKRYPRTGVIHQTYEQHVHYSRANERRRRRRKRRWRRGRRRKRRWRRRRRGTVVPLSMTRVEALLDRGFFVDATS